MLVFVDGRGAQVEHGDAGQIGDIHFVEGEVEKPERHPDMHRGVCEQSDNCGEMLVGRMWQRDDHIGHTQ